MENPMINTLSALGQKMEALVMSQDKNALYSQAQAENGWFTERNLDFCLHHWSTLLKAEHLEHWLQQYDLQHVSEQETKRIGIIMAGNIPMVGFHDLLCTLCVGHKAIIKLSAQDRVLMKWVINSLIEISPLVAEYIEETEGRLQNLDGIIATGSNNTSRYFDHYFSSIPHVFRKNRTGIAVLTGNESEEQLEQLMEDIFIYFGLGCRNVTKLYLPSGYDLNRIFKASLSYAHVSEHNKYMNNFQYYLSLWMLERAEILENGVIMLRKSNSLHSPIGSLFYEYYENKDQLGTMIEKQLNEVQVVVGDKNIPFGSAQRPTLTNYADGIDTMRFLLSCG